jgi:hypothetical protein
MFIASDEPCVERDRQDCPALLGKAVKLDSPDARQARRRSGPRPATDGWLFKERVYAASS